MRHTLLDIRNIFLIKYYKANNFNLMWQSLFKDNQRSKDDFQALFLKVSENFLTCKCD